MKLLLAFKRLALESLRAGEEYELLNVKIYKRDHIIYVRDYDANAIGSFNTRYSDGSKKLATMSVASMTFARVCLSKL